MNLQRNFCPLAHGVLLLEDPKRNEADTGANTPAQAMIQEMELRAKMKPAQAMSMRIRCEPSQRTECSAPAQTQPLHFRFGTDDGAAPLNIHGDIPNRTETPQRCANHLRLKIRILALLEELQKPDGNAMSVESFSFGDSCGMLRLGKR